MIDVEYKVTDLVPGRIGCGYIYLLGSHAHSFYKIGITRRYDFEQRIRSVQHGLPFDLEYRRAWICTCNPIWIEDRIKKEFKSHRTRGEWFYGGIQPFHFILSIEKIITEMRFQDGPYRIPGKEKWMFRKKII